MKTTQAKVAMVMVVVGVLLGGGEALAGKAKRGSAVQVSGVINLNTATAQQLDQLPGVGEKAARRILEYRQKTPFTRVEELVKVKGFGKKKFEKLKPHLAVAGPTTLKVTKGLPGTMAAPLPELPTVSPPAQGRTPKPKR